MAHYRAKTGEYKKKAGADPVPAELTKKVRWSKDISYW
jgi:hypothetical protein